MLESHTAPALSRLCGKDFGLNIFGPSSSGQILVIKFPHNFFFEETKTKMHLTIEFDLHWPNLAFKTKSLDRNVVRGERVMRIYGIEVED